MKILFVGGTGIISRACAELALARGMDVTLLNRGGRELVAGARAIQGDIHDPSLASALQRQTWDAVVDFIAFKPDEVAQRRALFEGHTHQYFFISSASVYQKPASHYLITEATPLVNPFWEYSRDKIACEEAFLSAYRESGFPITIVRPSYTYDRTLVPVAVNAWGKTYTAVDRMRRGLPVIVPGDGLTLWTMTHSTDFARGLVGLLGQRAALGHAFHITSDEVLSWNQIYQAVADAASVAAPKLVHLASEFIAAGVPEAAGSLLGDKANCAIFDNTKIKRFVPEFVASTRFADGIRESIAWFDADPARRIIDDQASARWDALLAANELGLEAARRMRTG
ncbi:MAG TPA: NAD-dependent epimerase/dehydratase family protein [Polyangiaceae bacterium]|nr:NAD-dependent epimerase/dehydratase family protein [Polyangiaceae bacterium]